LEVFDRYKIDPPKQFAKLGAAVDESSLGVVIAETCLLNPKVSDYYHIWTYVL